MQMSTEIQNDIPLLTAWITAGVNVDAEDYDGRTALHLVIDL